MIDALLWTVVVLNATIKTLLRGGGKGDACLDELVVALYKDDQTEVLLFITMSKVYLDCVMT